MYALLMGCILAGLTVLAGRFTGFEKERSFYPLILIFIALFYLFFAVIDSRAGVIILETTVMAIFFSGCLWI